MRAAHLTLVGLMRKLHIDAPDAIRRHRPLCVAGMVLPQGYKPVASAIKPYRGSTKSSTQMLQAVAQQDRSRAQTADNTPSSCFIARHSVLHWARQLSLRGYNANEDHMMMHNAYVSL